ncbi:MAG: type 1 glutamine amidotransferase [Myxococcales bacterium]|nr:type 1 glutamine amidotransferase [Myxococcales bacterium]
MTRALILDGSLYRDVYRPDEHWRVLLGDVSADAVHLPSGGAIPPLDSYTHLIVTGSEASIVEPADWYEPAIRAVRGAAQAGLRILGSCWGHQLLALALAGPAFVRRSPTPEVGWIEVERTGRDELLADLPDRWFVFASHFDEVVEPPAPWRVLARSPRCAVQVMRWGDRPVWGVQAHPEIDPSTARVLLEGFLRYAPRHAAVVRPALTAEPRDDRTAPALVARFLGRSRGGPPC